MFYLLDPLLKSGSFYLYFPVIDKKAGKPLMKLNEICLSIYFYSWNIYRRFCG